MAEDYTSHTHQAPKPKAADKPEEKHEEKAPAEEEGQGGEHRVYDGVSVTVHEGEAASTARRGGKGGITPQKGKE